MIALLLDLTVVTGDTADFLPTGVALLNPSAPRDHGIAGGSPLQDDNNLVLA